MSEVLVVSPDDGVRAQLVAACTELGIGAEGVADGMGAFQARRSSVAIVDVRMLDRVRAASPGARVLAVGGGYGVSEIAAAVLGGARGYLPTGCRGPALRAAIETVAADQLAIPPVLLIDVIDELVRQTLGGPPPRVALVS